MTFDAAIAAIKARLATAESGRDTWRLSGMQEKYLESCSMVEALELQLEQIEKAARESVSSGDAAGPPGEPERLMAEFGIAFNGRHYQYRTHRYQHLADAVSYAKVQRGYLPAIPEPAAPPRKVEVPNESQRKMMDAVGVTFRDGFYRLGDYCYDRLSDALDYAKLKDAQ